jgi:hypothetical protein
VLTVVTITTMRRPCQAAVAVCQAVVEAAAVAVAVINTSKSPFFMI